MEADRAPGIVATDAAIAEIGRLTRRARSTDVLPVGGLLRRQLPDVLRRRRAPARPERSPARRRRRVLVPHRRRRSTSAGTVPRSCSTSLPARAPACLSRRPTESTSSSRRVRQRHPTRERQSDESACLPRARRTSMGIRPRPVHHRADGRHRPDRLVDDLRHRPAHPQGRCPRGEARDDPRPRSGRNRRRNRRRGHDHRGRRPGARLVHQRLRALPLLQGGPLRPLHRRRRLDLRPPHRRPSGRVRARALRGHLRLQGAGRPERRAGALPRRHPADGLRGRRPQRTRHTGRHRRHRRRRPDRPRNDHDGQAAHAQQDHRDRPRRQRDSRRRSSSAPTRSSTTAKWTPSRR